MTPLRRLARPTREFRDCPLALIRIPENQQWFRLYGDRFAPMHFGSSGNNRFDSPDGGFGTLYLAEQIDGAFVEVFCRQRQRQISEEFLAQIHVAEFRSTQSLRLVDLAGKGLIRMGLDARICTGDYGIAQQWSRAFYEHPDQVDGIIYISRHDPEEKLVALFDRAQPALTLCGQGSFLDYMGESLFVLLDRYDMALL